MARAERRAALGKNSRIIDKKWAFTMNAHFADRRDGADMPTHRKKKRLVFS